MSRARVLALPAPASVRRESNVVAMLQLAFIAIHGPIAILIPKHSMLGTYHALATFAVGMVAAVFLRKPVLVASVGAYIAGSAVFWRMRAAPLLPWEFAKYAVIAILGAAVLFAVRISRPGLPILYFALLLPSVPLTLTAVPWQEARESLSFNLSGPLSMSVCVLFFSAIALTAAQMRWVAVSLLAPVFGIAVAAAYNLQQALEDPEFGFAGGSSNAVSSGGFGPNQVSAALGLGMVAILIYILLKPPRVVTAIMLAMVLFLARQCLITLSRGGMYMAAGAVVAAGAFLVQDPALRRRFLIGTVVIGAVMYFLVVPRLETMTGGVLVSRFENTSGTGRELLIKGDLESWMQSPIVGVGPGMGGANRLKYFYVPTAHTEYTRLFAEHGIFGGLALVVTVAIGLRAIRRQTSKEGRAISAALLTYAALFMAVDATRLVAPGFTVGLASTLLLSRRRRAATRRSGSREDGAATAASWTEPMAARR